MSADPDQWRLWVRKHKVAVGIGAAAVVLYAMAGGGSHGSSDPAGYDPGVSSPSPGDDSGFDKRRYDEDQRQDDDNQRNRIDTIREVERCTDGEGRVYESPLGTCS